MVKKCPRQSRCGTSNHGAASKPDDCAFAPPPVQALLLKFVSWCIVGNLTSTTNAVCCAREMPTCLFLRHVCCACAWLLSHIYYDRLSRTHLSTMWCQHRQKRLFEMLSSFLERNARWRRSGAARGFPI